MSSSSQWAKVWTSSTKATNVYPFGIILTESRCSRCTSSNWLSLDARTAKKNTFVRISVNNGDSRWSNRRTDNYYLTHQIGSNSFKNRRHMDTRISIPLKVPKQNGSFCSTFQTVKLATSVGEETDHRNTFTLSLASMICDHNFVICPAACLPLLIHEV